MKDAGLKPAHIDEIVLVGGMTRMPPSSRRSRRSSGQGAAQGRQPGRGRRHRRRDPGRRAGRRGQGRPPPRRDAAVARHRDAGRGHDQAHRAEHDHPDVEVADLHAPPSDDQSQVEIHVLQGERDWRADNKTLGRFSLDGIPPAPRGVPQSRGDVRHRCQRHPDVKAKDTGNRQGTAVHITASSMLDKSAVDQMVRDAQEHAEEDKQRREEVETRNQAEALSFQAERAIKDLGDKVSSDDKLEVENKIESLRESLKGSDMDAVKTGMTSLAEVLQRVSTAAYQAAASSAGDAGNGSSDGAGPDGGTGESDGGAGDGAGAGTRRRWRASSRRSATEWPEAADRASRRQPFHPNRRTHSASVSDPFPGGLTEWS